MIKLASLVVAGSLTVAGSAIGAPRSGVPNLDIRTTCGSRTGDMQSSVDSCMKDERSAKTELKRSWANIPAATRESCLKEVRIGGLPSYVELLTCAQMNQWSQEQTKRETTSRRR